MPVPQIPRDPEADSGALDLILAIGALADAGLTVAVLDGHADHCGGTCPRWVGIGLPTCKPSPCVCAKSREAAPEWTKRRDGGPTCWWQRKGFEEAPDGGYRSRCDCWGSNPAGMPEGCCSHHPASPWNLTIEQQLALKRFIPKLPPTPVVIDLTDEDVEIALADARNKKISSVERGWSVNRDRNIPGRTDSDAWAQEVWGCLGEAAIHRYLSLSYQGTNERGHDFRDAGLFEVRATARRDRGNEHLIFRPSSGDQAYAPYALVIVPRDVEHTDDRRAVIAGWLWGFECSMPEFWNDRFGHYWVPQGALRQMVSNPGPCPRSDASDNDVENLDDLGPGVTAGEAVPETWQGWGEAPPAPRPFVRRWKPEELCCPHPVPAKGIHCQSCCVVWATDLAFGMHRHDWTKPCRRPEDLVDVDTGAQLVYQDSSGAWAIDWAANAT